MPVSIARMSLRERRRIARVGLTLQGLYLAFRTVAGKPVWALSMCGFQFSSYVETYDSREPMWDA